MNTSLFREISCFVHTENCQACANTDNYAKGTNTTNGILPFARGCQQLSLQVKQHWNLCQHFRPPYALLFRIPIQKHFRY